MARKYKSTEVLKNLASLTDNYNSYSDCCHTRVTTQSTVLSEQKRDNRAGSRLCCGRFDSRQGHVDDSLNELSRIHSTAAASCVTQPNSTCLEAIAALAGDFKRAFVPRAIVCHILSYCHTATRFINLIEEFNLTVSFWLVLCRRE